MDDADAFKQKPEDSEDVQSQLYLGYETALLFWRAVHEGRLPAPQPIDARSVGPEAVVGCRALKEIDLAPLGVLLSSGGVLAQYDERTIDWGSRKEDEAKRGLVPAGIATLPGVPAPLHVLASGAKRYGTHACLKVHLVAGTLPAGSFYRVSDSIVVTSPELTFLQTCHKTRDLPNIELALELCGAYALHPAALPCRFDVAPVLTRERLERYVSCVGHRWGVQAVRRVLPWVRDGFASPRETELYLLLALDEESGGYGLTLPAVNEADDADDLPPGSAQYIADLVWKANGRVVVVEYDGFEEHERSAKKVAEDKERRSEMAARGEAVIVVTKRDLQSETTFAKKAAQIMRALEIDAEAAQTEQSDARSALFRWLSNPQHDHLPFGYGYR